MSKKRRNTLPRLFRFLGRILLSAGAILTVGLGVMLIYEASGSVNIGDETVIISDETPTQGSGMIKTSNVIWATLLVGATVIGLAFTVNKLNGFVRKSIKYLADFLDWPIFATEMVLSLAIWSLCTIFLLWWLPVGAIVSACALVLTEICFILAWLLYKRPKYTL